MASSRGVGSLLVCPQPGAVLIEAVVALEAIEGQMTYQRMLALVRDRVRQAPARGRRRLKALIPPAAVQIQIPERRASDEGTAVGGHVLDASPMAQQPQARDRRDERHRAFGDALNLRKLPALGIGVETVDMAAEYQAAFVGLGDVEQLGAEGEDVIEDRLDGRGDKSLQQVAL